MRKELIPLLIYLPLYTTLNLALFITTDDIIMFLFWSLIGFTAAACYLTILLALSPMRTKRTQQDDPYLAFRFIFSDDTTGGGYP